MTKANLNLAIIILTGFTAVIHLVLGAFQLLGGMMGGVMFILNTLGFVGLLLLFLNKLPFSVPVLSGNKNLQYYVFMAFSAVTIVAYFVVNGSSAFANPMGLLTKIVEALLIVALWLHQAK